MTEAPPFSLLVKPASADCNLACRYCFYLGHADFYPGTEVHRMDEACLERLVRDYLTARQRDFNLIWQGGEPTLMGLPFYRKAVELERRHAARGARVQNSLQTNGLLIDDEWARFLAEEDFLVGLSIDGPADLHDGNRRRTDGSGSYVAAMRAAECLAKRGVRFNILSVVTAQSAPRAHEIYRHHKSHGFGWLQFIPCVEFDAAGRLEPYSVGGPAWGRFLLDLADEWSRGDVGSVSVRFFEDLVNYLVLGRHTACHMMEECGTYFTVEHSGEIFPCDFFVERNLRVSALGEESWADRVWHPEYRGFGRAKARLHADCRGCEWLALCNGDCLKHRPGGLSRPDTKSVLCEGYSVFYREMLGGFRRLAEDVKARMRGPERAGD